MCRAASCLVVAVLSLLACGGRVAFDTLTESTGGTLSFGGATSTGGMMSAGASPNSTKDSGTVSSTAGSANTGSLTSSRNLAATGGTSGTGGTTGKRGTISQLPAQAVPICTFASGDHIDASGCQSRSVGVYMDSTSTYFAINYDNSIVQCPDGTVGRRVFESSGTYIGGDRTETLSGQILANGLIRLVCTTANRTGNGWYYNVTCSANCIQTIQPCPKAGSFFVEFPETGTDAGTRGYEDYIDGYVTCPNCPAKSMHYTSTSGNNAAHGTQPITYSAEGKTFWFDDMSGHLVTITLDAYYQVIDVQR